MNDLIGAVELLMAKLVAVRGVESAMEKLEQNLKDGPHGPGVHLTATEAMLVYTLLKTITPEDDK